MDEPDERKEVARVFLEAERRAQSMTSEQVRETLKILHVQAEALAPHLKLLHDGRSKLSPLFSAATEGSLRNNKITADQARELIERIRSGDKRTAIPSVNAPPLTSLRLTIEKPASVGDVPLSAELVTSSFAEVRTKGSLALTALLDGNIADLKDLLVNTAHHPWPVIREGDTYFVPVPKTGLIKLTIDKTLAFVENPMLKKHVDIVDAEPFALVLKKIAELPSAGALPDSVKELGCTKSAKLVLKVAERTGGRKEKTANLKVSWSSTAGVLDKNPEITVTSVGLSSGDRNVVNKRLAEHEEETVAAPLGNYQFSIKPSHTVSEWTIGKSSGVLHRHSLASGNVTPFEFTVADDADLNITLDIPKRGTCTVRIIASLDSKPAHVTFKHGPLLPRPFNSFIDPRGVKSITADPACVVDVEQGRNYGFSCSTKGFRVKKWLFDSVDSDDKTLAFQNIDKNYDVEAVLERTSTHTISVEAYKGGERVDAVLGYNDVIKQSDGTFTPSSAVSKAKMKKKKPAKLDSVKTGQHIALRVDSTDGGVEKWYLDGVEKPGPELVLENVTADHDIDVILKREPAKEHQVNIRAFIGTRVVDASFKYGETKKRMLLGWSDPAWEVAKRISGTSFNKFTAKDRASYRISFEGTDAKTPVRIVSWDVDSTHTGPTISKETTLLLEEVSSDFSVDLRLEEIKTPRITFKAILDGKGVDAEFAYGPIVIGKDGRIVFVDEKKTTRTTVPADGKVVDIPSRTTIGVRWIPKAGERFEQWSWGSTTSIEEIFVLTDIGMDIELTATLKKATAKERRIQVTAKVGDALVDAVLLFAPVKLDVSGRIARYEEGPFQLPVPKDGSGGLSAKEGVSYVIFLPKQFSAAIERWEVDGIDRGKERFVLLPHVAANHAVALHIQKPNESRVTIRWDFGSVDLADAALPDEFFRFELSIYDEAKSSWVAVGGSAFDKAYFKGGTVTGAETLFPISPPNNTLRHKITLLDEAIFAAKWRFDTRDVESEDNEEKKRTDPVWVRGKEIIINPVGGKISDCVITVAVLLKEENPGIHPLITVTLYGKDKRIRGQKFDLQLLASDKEPRYSSTVSRGEQPGLMARFENVENDHPHTLVLPRTLKIVKAFCETVAGGAIVVNDLTAFCKDNYFSLTAKGYSEMNLVLKVEETSETKIAPRELVFNLEFEPPIPDVRTADAAKDDYLVGLFIAGLRPARQKLLIGANGRHARTAFSKIARGKTEFSFLIADYDIKELAGDYQITGKHAGDLTKDSFMIRDEDWSGKKAIEILLPEWDGAIIKAKLVETEDARRRREEQEKAKRGKEEEEKRDKAEEKAAEKIGEVAKEIKDESGTGATWLDKEILDALSKLRGDLRGLSGDKELWDWVLAEVGKRFGPSWAKVFTIITAPRFDRSALNGVLNADETWGRLTEIIPFVSYLLRLNAVAGTIFNLKLMHDRRVVSLLHGREYASLVAYAGLDEPRKAVIRAFMTMHAKKADVFNAAAEILHHSPTEAGGFVEKAIKGYLRALEEEKV